MADETNSGLPANSKSSPNNERYRATVHVTLVGALLDLILGIAKLTFGFLAHSQALVADGIHSLSDLFTDALVLFAASHGSREADAEHPYGHRRIETVATIGLGVVLIAVAIGIAIDASQRLSEPARLLKPEFMALVVAGLSILSKEAIYRYTMHTALQYRSELLRANAWHSRTDAISSVIVVVGVGGTMLGVPVLDALAAIGVALMVVKIGWDLIWGSLRELVDTGLEPERVELIRKTILSVDGVKALHMLRTRRMGGDALIDVHIQVNPEISVSEGHQISESVRTTLISDVEELCDVTVHIDIEDDQAAESTHDLPLRTEVIQHAMELFAGIDEIDEIEQITLHYSEGKIQLELLLPLSRAQDSVAALELTRRLQAAISEDELISSVKVRLG